ncbi:MAG: hypothetical protein LBG99_00665 [Propionibacteriaceae bacterium]|jgi:hypothetical protein|nr:hypothetical protein [Propionibacteriaceae bacterium]
MEVFTEEIHLARQGKVTDSNHTRLGFDRIIHGVYGRPLHLDGLNEWDLRRAVFLQRVRALMAVYAPQGFTLYGSTALQTMGVALPHDLEQWDRFHVLVPPGRVRPQRQMVTGHRTIYSPDARFSINGFKFLHPIEHLLQIQGATDDQFIQIAEGFLRRRNPILTIDDMRQHLVSLKGRPGIQQARRVMKWVQPETDSINETRTRLTLIRGGLPEPKVNCRVYSSSLSRNLHVDMGYEKEKLGVEYDGLVHVGDRRQMEMDASRRRILLDEGWVIITATAVDLVNPLQLVRSVKATLYERRHHVRTSW